MGRVLVHGTLYRINPRSAVVTGHTDLGERAGRPEVQFGNVWVVVSDGGGTPLQVDPRTLYVVWAGDCCLPLGEGYDDVDGYGSIWQIDWPAGTVVRWDTETKDVDESISLTGPPIYDGLCLTSIAAGAGGVWVTAAPSIGYTCPR